MSILLIPIFLFGLTMTGVVLAGIQTAREIALLQKGQEKVPTRSHAVKTKSHLPQEQVAATSGL